jgi:uncharacterized Fe-S cluster-containing radical SAM superfamily protein
MSHPLETAGRTERIACGDGMRKYYRFRAARFYGGISTADCVGCPLRCVFCWSWREVARPEAYGEFHPPEEVARRLICIAKKKGYRQLRISGNEPTLCRGHLMRVLSLIPLEYLFILETNGVLIDRGYAEELSRFPNLHVRVSLKGTCGEEFARLTGAPPEGFGLQLGALEALHRSGVKAHPACMVSFSPPENIRALRKRLKAMAPEFGDFEEEELILYPRVEERLRRLGIKYRTAHRPDGVPAEQI